MEKKNFSKEDFDLHLKENRFEPIVLSLQKELPEKIFESITENYGTKEKWKENMKNTLINGDQISSFENKIF